MSKYAELLELWDDRFAFFYDLVNRNASAAGCIYFGRHPDPLLPDSCVLTVYCKQNGEGFALSEHHCGLRK